MVQQKIRILFADDDLFYLQGLIAELEENDYEVLRAETAREAVDLIRSEHLDLIILDIMMPIGDAKADPREGETAGIAVTRFIRSLLKDIPIIYLTVVVDQSMHSAIEEVERKAELTKKPRILVKPVEPERLLREVVTGLREARPSHQSSQ